MAGLVAASANNSICAMGVAFDASLGAVKIYEGSAGRMSYDTPARAISYDKKHLVDIFVYGFGPKDRSFHVIDMGPLEKTAMKEGARKGRQGKGTLYVYPPGNGGVFQDSCALDGRANSIYTLALNAVGETGSAPKYVENCTAIIASAFSAGRYPEKYMVTTDSSGRCTESFGGTSSSAALAAGAAALLLQV